MARKPRAVSPSTSAESSPPLEETLGDPPSSIDPYKALAIDKSATQNQIKSAYRKAALKHHPDKASPVDKEIANQKFQEVAFAYAILSDERRRKRYDTTGNTAETLNVDDDDFDWTDFFREQTAAFVDGDKIDQIKRDYQGSDEEKDDLLQAFEEHEGDMDAIYETIMCSNVLDDDERFRAIIDNAIADGSATPHKKYTNESLSSKKKRTKRAKDEADEAMQLAEELGVKDKLFGKKKGKKESDEDVLKSIIQQRQQSRGASFLDRLEAKYGGKGSKRGVDEPPEEAFANSAKKRKGKPSK